MAGLFDILGGLGLGSGDQGDAPMSRLGLAAGNADRGAQPPAAPSWGFGDPSNGDPLFGQQSQPDDAVIDPDTGVSKGFLRRDSNKQALMTGLMLIAAGSSRDDGARAQILSGISNNMDSSSRIQNFAKMRLDLARARLADQNAKSQAASDAALNAYLDKASGGAPAAAPAGAPMPQPGPSAGAVGPQAAPAAAAVAAGTGNAADAAIVAGASSGAPQPAPGAAPAQPAPAAAPQPAPAPGSVLGPNAILPEDPPKKITPPAFHLTPDQATLIKSLDPAGRRQALEKAQADWMTQEHAGDIITIKGTNKRGVPIYSGSGDLKGITPVGDGTVTASIRRDAQGNVFIDQRDAQGNTLDTKPTELQSDKDQQRLDADDLGTAKTNAATLQKNATALMDAPQRALRADQAIKDIGDGKVNTGPASGFLNYGKRLLDTFGGLSDDEKQKLLATDNAAGLEGTIVAKLAKANNGSQVTDADVKFAQSIVTGGGSPDEIAAALTRYKQDLRNDVAIHNQAAERHNGLIGNVKAGGYSAGQLKVDTIKMPTDENVPDYATPETVIGTGQKVLPTPLRMLGKGMADGGEAPIQGAPSAAKAAPPVTISDAASYHKLASGTHYVDPNGVARIKP